MAAPVPHNEIFEEMTVDSTNVVNNGEPEIPSQEDGPWSVSVADAPSNNNKKKYTIHVQTPTQNLNLIRASQEITDLHAKLRSNRPKTAVPPLPGFPASGADTTGNAKRRSSFLNTLIRLANPNPKPSLLNTSQSITPSAMKEGTEQTMPALAAYLTLVGNHPIFRKSRAWRRFVRVRTDDLQSVRAERVVKRVRSESGLGRSGSHGGSASGKPIPDLPFLSTMGSFDVRGSVSDTNLGFSVVSDILASPSMQQATATPLPPGTPEPPSTPAYKSEALPGVESTPTCPKIKPILYLTNPALPGYCTN